MSCIDNDKLVAVLSVELETISLGMGRCVNILTLEVFH